MRVTNPAIHFVCCLILVATFAGAVFGQSLEISAPAPISTREVVGSIGARDLGDSRLTDHYYAFAANPGDLLITIESRNLNGDVDVFTAGSLRPLMKFTVYAESSAPVTKGVFLRKREDLVLRVQARTPNDDEGIYQIRFGGSFEPLEPSPLLAQTPNQDDPSVLSPADNQKGRRVSSVGARIPEPESPKEIAATPTPEPTPAPAETPAAEPAERSTAVDPPVTSPRTRGRRPTGRRGSRSRPPVETARETETATTRTEEPAEPTEPTTPRSSRRGSTRRTQPPETSEETPQDVPDTGPRLVIETSDGTLIDRSMTTVRRVMVENGQVVVVGKDGRVVRLALARVVRMSISPQ